MAKDKDVFRDDDDDVVPHKDQPLIPLGSDNKPLGKLAAIDLLPAKPKDLTKKPKDEAFAAQRVALFARDQIKCPVHFRRIEAKRITENTYRINFLGDDKGPATVSGFATPKPAGALITTHKWVHSAMVKVEWGAKLVLTEMVQPERNATVNVG